MSPKLPPELWHQVFFWATYSPIRTRCLEPVPFAQLTLSHNSLAPMQQVLLTKHTLTLVCLQWKAMTTEYLYEDIHLGHGVLALADMLDGVLGSSPTGLAKHVRRICFPLVTPGSQEASPEAACRILRACPNVTALACYDGKEIRDGAGSEVPLQTPQLEEAIASLKLRRFDWENRNKMNSRYFPNFIRMSADLESLSIRGGVRFMPRVAPMVLPRVATLRLRTNIFESAYPIRVFLRTVLPSLKHVVLEVPLPGSDIADYFWLKFRQTLRTVEFGRHVEFFRSDFATSMLTSCDYLEVFNYPVYFCQPLLARNASLKQVGLHSAPNAMLQDQNHWTHLLLHFTSLCTKFPSLESIKLYGTWEDIIRHERFQPALRRVSSRRLSLLNQGDIAINWNSELAVIERPE